MSKERNNPGRFKKQCMVALLAAGLFLGATGSAKAIDFKVAGEWLVGFGVGDSNLTKHTRDAQGGPKTKSNSNDDFAAGQRVRLQLDAVASEALSGTVFFEIGNQTWGKADQGGALGADGTNVIKVKRAYIDWAVPDTDLKFRMGIQGVALPNKAGGSAAFGRWASRAVTSRRGAQLLTMLLGVLIFIDDYFNCLTVGAVMRPVTESHKISRAKLAYIIDATAAPVCMLAPVSSWAAAVASYVPDGFPGSRISMFLSQIPWNYYCILTLVMVITISVLNIDYGPMLTHEYNAQVKDDLFTTPERPFEGADDYEEGEKHSSVLDLLLPVIVLIGMCIVGLIWTGGVFDPESENYQNFVMAFSDASAGPGLCLGSIVALVFTFIYYWLRGLIGFTKSMESIPNGFIQMISPILILCFAWTLCGLCRDNGLMVGDFVGGIMEGTGSLAKFLPAVIFIVACFIGFATGTSWGTIGIMVPLVCAVFDWTDQVTLLSIGLAASCAGGVCGDHLSPISDTTIMASAGAHCFHLNHVATQIPYGVTVAAVSFVSFIIAGLVQQVVVCMIIAIVLMIGTLLVIRAVTAKKHKGIFQEMAAADKALYNK